MSYEICRGPCPKCGFKFARIERYRLITVDGAYDVEMIRCMPSVLDKTRRKRRVGGCGEITKTQKRRF